MSGLNAGDYTEKELQVLQAIYNAQVDALPSVDELIEITKLDDICDIVTHLEKVGILEQYLRITFEGDIEKRTKPLLGRLSYATIPYGIIYLKPEETIERVTKQVNVYGIKPLLRMDVWDMLHK